MQKRNSDSSWWIDSSVSSSVTSGGAGSGSPVEAVEDAAQDLDEPGAARVDDARLAQLVEELGRPRDGVVAARRSPARAPRRPAASARRDAPPPRPSRG